MRKCNRISKGNNNMLILRAAHFHDCTFINNYYLNRNGSVIAVAREIYLEVATMPSKYYEYSQAKRLRNDFNRWCVRRSLEKKKFISR